MLDHIEDNFVKNINKHITLVYSVLHFTVFTLNINLTMCFIYIQKYINFVAVRNL